MSAWIVFLIAAVIFFIVEIYTTTMFFLNFAFAAAICSIFGIFTENYNVLIPIFVILSVIFLLFLRPLFNIHAKNKTKNLDSQYLNQQATALTDINAFSGRLKIFDENWEARTLDEDAPTIKKGTKVKIINHNDLTMYVEKLSKKGEK